MIVKSTTVWMKLPIPNGPALMVEKSTPPITALTIGMIRSSTTEPTIFPNAPPITTPTAMSTTFPRIANALNSEAMDIWAPSCSAQQHRGQMGDAITLRHGASPAFRNASGVAKSPRLASRGWARVKPRST